MHDPTIWSDLWAAIKDAAGIVIALICGGILIVLWRPPNERP